MVSIVRPANRRTCRLVALLSTLIGSVTGCVQYEDKPLASSAVEKTLATPDDHTLRIETTRLKHPLLSPMPVELGRGLSPDEAAVLAVIVNPELRAERDQRGIAMA